LIVEMAAGELRQLRLEVDQLTCRVQRRRELRRVAGGELGRKRVLTGKQLQLLIETRLRDRIYLQRQGLVRRRALVRAQRGQHGLDCRVLRVRQVRELGGAAASTALLGAATCAQNQRGRDAHGDQCLGRGAGAPPSTLDGSHSTAPFSSDRTDSLAALQLGDGIV
jgi:hypothetical protein